MQDAPRAMITQLYRNGPITHSAAVVRSRRLVLAALPQSLLMPDPPQAWHSSSSPAQCTQIPLKRISSCPNRRRTSSCGDSQSSSESVSPILYIRIAFAFCIVSVPQDFQYLAVFSKASAAVLLFPVFSAEKLFLCLSALAFRAVRLHYGRCA